METHELRYSDVLPLDLELASSNIRIFDDGEDPPAEETLTTSFVYGDFFEVGSSTRLTLYLTKTTANDPDYVDLEVLLSDDDGVTTYPLDVCNQVSGGFDYRTAGIIRITDIGADNPTRRIIRVNIEPDHSYKIGVRYSGGTAPDLLIKGKLSKI